MDRHSDSVDNQIDELPECRVDAKTISAIDGNTVHRICSGQGIPDLAVAVKELVENSIDAGATKVEVKLKQHGYESFEVIDNGFGVNKENYPSLAKKHHTSKINDFQDLLNGVSSFGFRGEALSSLCELSGPVKEEDIKNGLSGMVIITRTKDDPLANKLTFYPKGDVAGSEPYPGQCGTSVLVQKLFDPLPVRRREFKKHLKRQYAKMLLLIQAYGIVSTGVKISVVNFVNGKRINALTTQGRDMRGNIANVFGSKALNELQPVEFEFSAVEKLSEFQSETGGNQDIVQKPLTPAEGEKIIVKGFVSKFGSGIGRSTAGDRQFLFINGRPVQMVKVTKVINDAWRKYEMKQKPAFVLNIMLPKESVDVNVTPDKRQVIMNQEAVLTSNLKDKLDALWKPTQFTYKTKSVLEYLEASSTTTANTSNVERSDEEEAETDEVDVIDKLNSSRPDSRASKDSSNEPISDSTSGGFDAAANNENELFACDSKTVSSSCSEVPERNNEHGTSVMTLSIDTDGGDHINGVTSLTSEKWMDEKNQEEMDFAKESEKPSDCDHAKIVDEGEFESDSDEMDAGQCKEERRNSSSSSRKGECLLKNDHDRSDSDNEDEDEESPLTFSHGSAISRNQRKRSRQMAKELFREASGNQKVLNQEETDRNPNDNKLEVIEENVVEKNKKQRTSGTSGNESGTTTRLVFKAAPKTLQCSGIEKAFLDRVQFRNHSLHAGQDKNNEEIVKNKEENLYESAGVANPQGTDLQKATDTLERVFKKEDFKIAQILGQFNLGFILTRVRNDLFIMDQHACDEIYRFETLHRTTKIHEQKLIRPLPIDLSASEVQVIMDNMQVFEKNGFRFQVNENTDETYTLQLSLIAIPHSFKVEFGADDVRELASILRNNPAVAQVKSNSCLRNPKQYFMPLLPKTRAMFASRACRGAIMIGTALEYRTMIKEIRNLATIDRPWNCPHGRPTMRHLLDLEHFYKQRNFDGSYFKFV